VKRLEGEGLEDEQVERALREIGFAGCHALFFYIYGTHV
jgi:hypothetical protein